MSKPIFWSEAKNDQLRFRHGIGFEEVIIALERGRLLDEREHPNTEQYGHQRQLVVEIDDYAYVVSYIDDQGHYFFKTLYPSRTATREYLVDPNST